MTTNRSSGTDVRDDAPLLRTLAGSLAAPAGRAAAA